MFDSKILANIRLIPIDQPQKEYYLLYFFLGLYIIYKHVGPWVVFFFFGFTPMMSLVQIHGDNSISFTKQLL